MLPDVSTMNRMFGFRPAATRAAATEDLGVVRHGRRSDEEAVAGAKKHTQGADFRGTHGEFLKLADAKGFYVSRRFDSNQRLVLGNSPLTMTRVTAWVRGAYRITTLRVPPVATNFCN